MIRKQDVVRGHVGARKHYARVAITVLMVSLVGSVTIASPAPAATQPTGDFAVFKQCPRFTTGVGTCFYSQITSGVTTLGKLTVPIVNPVTFQAGIIFIEPKTPTELETETFVDALDGETFSPTPQPVPGGLSSLIDCDEIKGRGLFGRLRGRACRAMLDNHRFAAVNETTELASPAGEIFFSKRNEVDAEGTALALPVRIHLENPLLGRDCYIGSSTDPIIFNLTTGTTNPPPPNTPIKGNIGQIEFHHEFEIVRVTEHLQVDNAFPVPAATGCGGHLASLINPLINNKIGLPAPSGHNTITHYGNVTEATPGAVIRSEQEEPNTEQHHEHKQDQDTGHHNWWH
jgi:hypothetical protein